MIIEFKNSNMDLVPTKIIALARNYSAHAAEMKSSIPDEPTIFLKPPSSLIGDGGVVILPSVSRRVDYEVELAVIMKTQCSHVSVEQALHHVLGYSILIDVTARDIQAEAKKKGISWAVAKGFDTFAPLGPRIASASSLNPHDCDIWLNLNGERKQQGNTRNMIFPVEALISHISRIMTLEPMDIIATGTPEGVGPLKDGDTIEAGIEGIGTLTLHVQGEGS
ncbi:MAG: fumarylacetoacetate hydrolase family protein [Candidatus Thorarchaeota archaeon]|jgi:2-keto-4-pentenoate hydratase/2-oxohepta-3-ene-1,7-dioic acid hydratase in catechol pathway